VVELDWATVIGLRAANTTATFSGYVVRPEGLIEPKELDDCCIGRTAQAMLGKFSSDRQQSPTLLEEIRQPKLTARAYLSLHNDYESRSCMTRQFDMGKAFHVLRMQKGATTTVFFRSTS
jgi:hypothetical protein